MLRYGRIGDCGLHCTQTASVHEAACCSAMLSCSDPDCQESAPLRSPESNHNCWECNLARIRYRLGPLPQPQANP